MINDVEPVGNDNVNMVQASNQGIENMRQENETLKQQLETFTNEREDLLLKLDTAKKEAASHLHKAELSRNGRNELIKERDGLQAEIDSLRQDHAKICEEYDRLVQSQEQSNKESRDLITNLKTLLEDMQKLEHTRNDNESLVKERDELKYQVMFLRQEYNTIREEYVRLAKDKELTNKERQELITILELLRKDLQNRT